MAESPNIIRHFRDYMSDEIPDLRHFEASEFLVHTGRKLNTMPPLDLWPNILPTARVLDQLRERLGVPVVITSCYRSPKYNRLVGGVKNSQHVQFRAADIYSPHATLNRIFAELKAMRSEGGFKGGLGIYPRRGIVHVDTRGVNVTWQG